MCPPMSYYNFFPMDYRLICPSTNQVLSLEQYWCNSEKFFDQKNETWLWNVFASRTPNAQRPQHFQPRARPGGKLSLLERLPGELIEEILDIIMGDEDRPGAVETALLFGLSSDRLWPVVLRRIHGEYARAFTTNWAGKRVGYHGSFSHPTTSQIEMYNIGKSFFAGNPWRHWYLTPFSGNPEEEWRKSASEIEAVCYEFSAKEWEQIHEDLSQAYLYPQDRVWVLRNLTMNQFVRSDKIRYSGSVRPSAMEDIAIGQPASHRLNITKLWKTVTGKGKEIISPIADKMNIGYKPLTLAQVFLVLTCFSDIYETPYQERVLDFQQGPWAAHAFDLVTLEEHEASNARTAEQCKDDRNTDANAEMEIPEWKDVSEVAAADVGSMRKFVLENHGLAAKGRRTARHVRDASYWATVTETRRKDRAWAKPADL